MSKNQSAYRRNHCSFDDLRRSRLGDRFTSSICAVYWTFRRRSTLLTTTYCSREPRWRRPCTRVDSQLLNNLLVQPCFDVQFGSLRSASVRLQCGIPQRPFLVCCCSSCTRRSWTMSPGRMHATCRNTRTATSCMFSLHKRCRSGDYAAGTRYICD